MAYTYCCSAAGVEKQDTLQSWINLDGTFCGVNGNNGDIIYTILNLRFAIYILSGYGNEECMFIYPAEGQNIS